MRSNVFSARRTRITHMIVGGIRDWFEANRLRVAPDSLRVPFLPGDVNSYEVIQ